MKVTIERVAIIVLGIVLIIFVMKDCSRPSEQREADRKKMYETELAINQAEKIEAQGIQDSIVKFYRDSIAKINVVVKAQDKRNEVLTKQLVKLRTPRVDTLIIENPDLKSFVDTQTEIIQEQSTQIDTLKSVIDFQRKINEDLIITEIMEDKIESSMQIENSQRIAELEKLSKKKERKSRFAKVLIPIALVCGFLFGASL